MPVRVRSARALVPALLAAIAIATVTSFGVIGATPDVAIEASDKVEFFPTFAVEGAGPSWSAEIHGWIFEPQAAMARDALAVVFRKLVRERFDLTTPAIEGDLPDAARRFDDRMSPFLVDNHRGRALTVRAGDASGVMGKSEKNGHFAGTVTLPSTAGRAHEWVTFRAVVGPGDTRVFEGKVQLVARTGVTVVSDIDDTIKHSQVRDKVQLGLNTFVRDFRATPGMAALYQRWAQGGPVVFHYVSGSPFQLYGHLAEFARRDGFPDGSYHLRKFRLKDRSIAAFFASPETFKLETIRPILKQFRERRFILVGDSGERDPEVYATLASEFDNVDAIFIRDVTNETLTAPRYVTAFATVPARVQRRVFTDTRELDDITLR